MRFNPWEQITALSYSPDGEIIAVSAGGKIYLVDAQEWRVRAAIDVGVIHFDIQFSPDGSWLAAGGRDGSLRASFKPSSYFSTESEIRPDIEIEAHKKGINSVAFRPDGQLLASGGNDAVARLWDLPSGSSSGTIIGGTFAVSSISFSPDGSVLAILNGEIIRLRDVDSERIVGTFISQQPLLCVAFNPDGSLIAAGDNANSVMIWRVDSAYRTGREEYPKPIILTGHAGNPGSYEALIWKVSFNTDGRLLVSAGGDSTIRLWDVSNATQLIALVGHEKGATSVDFHPNSYGIVSGGLDGVLRLWGIIQ